ncbi:Uma2 family endonuclease [Kribbella antibiotica]|uniref:Uma2 family endonuclease n=1 Tax=Kribbella antibiotica TaxID=190195 RepID=A0A4R4ZMI9_9ACTN|nr:Uma2 family endonuclease [Kribbella antibiotica]
MTAALHREVGDRIQSCLAAACPGEMEVVRAAFRYRLRTQGELNPDLMVRHRQEVKRSSPMLLAVEIARPSTLATDWLQRCHAYAELGVAAFWTFEPRHAVLSVRESRDGQRFWRTIEGAAVFETSVPFPVRMVPSELSRSVGR